MKIQVEVRGADEIIAAFQKFPGALNAGINRAVNRTMASAGQLMADVARKRYKTVPEWFLKQSMGKPFVNGGVGMMRVRGPRIPLYLLPHRDIYPGGASFEEVAGHPSVLPHSFIPGHPGRSLKGLTKRKHFSASTADKIYTRVPGVKSLPIRPQVGLSASQMINTSRDDIKQKVEEKISERFNIELGYVIDALLEGVVSWNGKRFVNVARQPYAQP